MHNEQEQEALVFNPDLISDGNKDVEVIDKPEEEKLNLFKEDTIFDTDEAGEEKELDDNDAPTPDDIKDDESEEDIFSVALGQELMDGGVLSTFDKEAIAKIEAEEGRGAAMKALLSTQAKVTADDIKAGYDAEYQEYLSLRDNGVSKESITEIQQLEGFAKSINEVDLKGEDEGSVQARKDVLTLDYRLNTKFSEERIQKLVNKAYDEGSDLEEIDEAKGRVDEYISSQKQTAIDNAKTENKRIADSQKKQTDDLVSFVDKTEEYFKGEKVTTQVREQMKKLLTTPIKLANGTVTSALWAERDKDPVKFDSGIAYLKAIGYFDNKPLDKFVKNATTKATSKLESMLDGSSARSFAKSSNKSFSKNDNVVERDFLDF